MKSFTAAALALVLSFATGATFAADAPAKTLTTQQQRMKDCNVQAKGKKGEERRAFMSTCLKGGKTSAAPAAVAQKKSKAKGANGATH